MMNSSNQNVFLIAKSCWLATGLGISSPTPTLRRHDARWNRLNWQVATLFSPTTVISITKCCYAWTITISIARTSAHSKSRRSSKIDSSGEMQKEMSNFPFGTGHSHHPPYFHHPTCVIWKKHFFPLCFHLLLHYNPPRSEECPFSRNHRHVILNSFLAVMWPPTSFQLLIVRR